MPSDWYVDAGGLRRGPLTDAQLAELARTGFLKPYDQVCCSAMSWTPALSVPGLFPGSGSMPSPTAPSSPVLHAPPVAQAAPMPAPPRAAAIAEPRFTETPSYAGSRLARKRSAAGGRSLASLASTIASILVGAAAAMYAYINYEPLIHRLTGRDRVEPEPTIEEQVEILVQPATTKTALPPDATRSAR